MIFVTSIMNYPYVSFFEVLIDLIWVVWEQTVIMGFWGCSSRWKAAEKCVRLKLCILVSTLGCHVFGWLKRFVHISRNENRSFQSGMDAISPHQTRFSPERLAIIYVAPSRQPDVKKDDMRLNMSSLVRFGPEKTSPMSALVRVWQCFCKITQRRNINFSDLRFGVTGCHYRRLE